MDTQNPSPASPASSVPPAAKKKRGQKINKVTVLLVALIVFLMGAIGLGVYLVGQKQKVAPKAFTGTTTFTDSCNRVSVSISELTSCPKLADHGNITPGSNNVSTYQTSVTIKNSSTSTGPVAGVCSSAGCEQCLPAGKSSCTEACKAGGYGSVGWCAVPNSKDQGSCCSCANSCPGEQPGTGGQSHTVKYTVEKDYCTSPYGDASGAGITGYVCHQNLPNTTSEVTLGPGESKTIPISNSSTNGQACGSFQHDFWINSVDNDTNCSTTPTSNLLWGLCQTGVSCSAQPTTPVASPTTITPTVSTGPTNTPTPTKTPTPTSGISPSATPTSKPTNTPIPVATNTSTPTPTKTPTPTPTGTLTPTPTGTLTSTVTPTPTAVVLAQSTATPTPAPGTPTAVPTIPSAGTSTGVFFMAIAGVILTTLLFIF